MQKETKVDQGKNIKGYQKHSSEIVQTSNPMLKNETGPICCLNLRKYLKLV